MIGTDLISLVTHILNVTRVHGVNNLKKKLEELQYQGIPDLKIILIDDAINEVVKSYGITRKDLFHGKRKGATSDARKMCYIILTEHFSLSEKEAAWYFERHPKVVYRALDEFKNMSNGVKWQRDFLAKKKEISNRVEVIIKLKTEQGDN